MLMPDLALTQRLEFHEAWSSRAHARVQARLYPETGATSLPFAGGHAVYCGRSPFTQVYGAGLSGPVRAADLDAVEAFYRDRGSAVHLRLCPLADRSLIDLLGERPYRVQNFMNVYVQDLRRDAGSTHSVPAGFDIRVATRPESTAWFERLGAQGDWAEPDGVAFMDIRCTLKPGARLFLAWRDGAPIGGGALEVHDGMAALMAAETLPEFRRQGVQTALLRVRLAAAVEAGCDVAMVHTRPGVASQRNVLRAGFQVAYTVVAVARHDSP